MEWENDKEASQLGGGAGLRVGMCTERRYFKLQLVCTGDLKSWVAFNRNAGRLHRYEAADSKREAGGQQLE